MNPVHWFSDLFFLNLNLSWINDLQTVESCFFLPCFTACVGLLEINKNSSIQPESSHGIHARAGFHFLLTPQGPEWGKHQSDSELGQPRTRREPLKQFRTSPSQSLSMSNSITNPLPGQKCRLTAGVSLQSGHMQVNPFTTLVSAPFNSVKVYLTALCYILMRFAILKFKYYHLSQRENSTSPGLQRSNNELSIIIARAHLEFVVRRW